MIKTKFKQNFRRRRAVDGGPDADQDVAQGAGGGGRCK